MTILTTEQTTTRTGGRIEIRGTMHPRFDEVLTPEALEFLAQLHDRFGQRRCNLLAARDDRRREISQGANSTSSPRPDTSARMRTGRSPARARGSKTVASKLLVRPTAR